MVTAYHKASLPNCPHWELTGGFGRAQRFNTLFFPPVVRPLAGSRGVMSLAHGICCQQGGTSGYTGISITQLREPEALRRETMGLAAVHGLAQPLAACNQLSTPGLVNIGSVAPDKPRTKQVRIIPITIIRQPELTISHT